MSLAAVLVMLLLLLFGRAAVVNVFTQVYLYVYTYSSRAVCRASMQLPPVVAAVSPPLAMRQNGKQRHIVCCVLRLFLAFCFRGVFRSARLVCLLAFVFVCYCGIFVHWSVRDRLERCCRSCGSVSARACGLGSFRARCSSRWSTWPPPPPNYTRENVPGGMAAVGHVFFNMTMACLPRRPSYEGFSDHVCSSRFFFLVLDRAE